MLMYYVNHIRNLAPPASTAIALHRVSRFGASGYLREGSTPSKRSGGSPRPDLTGQVLTGLWPAMGTSAR